MLCCGPWTVTPSAGLASVRYQGSGTPPRGCAPRPSTRVCLHHRGNEALLERVLNANALVRFSAKTLDKAIRLGIATLAENPRNSYYWEFEEIDALRDLPEVDDFEYMGCSLGGARAKKQRIRSNVKELGAIRCQCRHTHDPTEWDRRPDPSGHGWVYPTSEEAEFTAEMAFLCAVQLSVWAVKTGRARLWIPRWPPRPCETGRRDLLLQVPAVLLRREAMAGLGLRLGLRPPRSIGHNLPALRSTENCSSPTDWPNAVYIGAGCPRHKLAPGVLAPRYRPGPDGDAATCVALYARDMMSDSELWNAISAIAPWVENLICDCTRGYPCHGEVVAVAVLNYRRSAGAAPTQPQLQQPRKRRRRRGSAQRAC